MIHPVYSTINRPLVPSWGGRAAGSERRGRRPDALRPRRLDRGGGAGSGCAGGREDRRPSDRLGGGAGPAVAPAHGGTADGGDDPLGVLLGGDLGAERVGADPGVLGLAAEGELAQDALHPFLTPLKRQPQGAGD